MAVQYQGNIFYRACRDIGPGIELFTYYGDDYSFALGVGRKELETPSDDPLPFRYPVKVLDPSAGNIQTGQLGGGTGISNNSNSISNNSDVSK